jgi:CRP-like cAMP-binding protein
MSNPRSLNHFLASLSDEDWRHIQPYLRKVDFPHGKILYVAHEDLTHVYFPHSGVISLVVGLTNGQFVEAGMMGRNGVVGGGSALDGRKALNQAIVQAPGDGSSIDIDTLRRLARESETLRLALMHQEQIGLAYTQQVAACNATHELEERLSRWLLQTRDLLQTNTLPLTQEFLSQMLGVQRTSVTVTARRLQEAGMIQYKRARINVLDVDALHDTTCECYDAINAQFKLLIGWVPVGATEKSH